MTTSTLIAGILLLGILVWSFLDYRKWLALGKGGVPHNLIGWLMVTATRPIKRNPLATKFFEEDIGKPCDSIGFTTLPKRTGSKPSIAPHPVPHRQLDQIGIKTVRQNLKNNFDALVQENKVCKYALSQYEKRNQAVWLANPTEGNPCTCAKGEIAHIHPIDGSMHMVLSPTDAKTVIEAGWGELHPLAGRLLPSKTYTLIYSPRNEDDLIVINTILKAAVQYASLKVK